MSAQFASFVATSGVPTDRIGASICIASASDPAVSAPTKHDLTAANLELAGEAIVRVRGPALPRVEHRWQVVEAGPPRGDVGGLRQGVDRVRQ
ncbi:hypothetical protein [Candidatus Mycolicibacterium alkanivorans]|uniref:Uncharacterized protein n=1 Tax=Candidatus Mycolicibacterium alkanivorans TaxID=2954114 RepID=A0ABS9YV78_9MYCO|nr:hypothetical protein [Candidatus Mycolicibacterium alkanivorans]MCI4675133.1 hypothetical protein [Candidatus Mycolicibacterium alkanivorans]